MILYFTGTGNSRHIAAVLANILGERDVIDISAMIKRNERGDFDSEGPYIFVAPTYAWRLPRIVSDFMEKSKFSGNKKAYFVLTCGDSIGNAEKYADLLCRRVGMDFRGCAGVKMPENYIAMFKVPDKETSDKLVAEADRSLMPLAEKIKNGDVLTEKKSLAGAIESSLINNLFYKFVISAKGFRVTDECVSCGLCEDVCPVNNVQMKDGEPRWGNKCIHCMACISRCPKEAIEYKNISVGKRRYYLE